MTRRLVAAYPHNYGGGSACIYCDAPGSASGEPCSVAEEVERDGERRLGRYDPYQHLRALVEALKRQEPGWTLAHASSTKGGTPLDCFVVRRGDEVIVEASGVVRDLAARTAGAKLWRWRKGAGGRG